MFSKVTGRSSVQDPVSVTPQHPPSCSSVLEPSLGTASSKETQMQPLNPAAICMRRTELLQLQQKLAKTFRTFTAKIGSRAETFSYANKCTGGALVDYTDHVILDVILNGLYDTDIRREVLAAQGILEKLLNDITLLPPYSLSLLSRKKRRFYQTPSLSPLKQIGPKR